MNPRAAALAKLRELPTWPDIVVLLDRVIGAHPDRIELELLMTLLVLQAAENAERRALDRVNVLVDELRAVIAAVGQGRVLHVVSDVPTKHQSPV